MATGVSVSADGSKGVKQELYWISIRLAGVSVSADGSKGVKPRIQLSVFAARLSFSIRRWIEGCEAVFAYAP